MNVRSIYQPILNYSRKIHWSLLLLLILVLNVKMLVKFVGLVVLLIIHRRLFREKTIYRQHFIWFYVLMILLAFLNLLLTIPSFSSSYLFAVFVACIFWIMSIGSAFLCFWFVNQAGKEKLDQTLDFFFMLNVAVSILQLIWLMCESGAINPYIYQGEFQKYFINTGDRVKGISFDLSATNSFINAFGVLYFIQQQKIARTGLCMLALLLSVSNYTNLLLVGVMVILFFFFTNRLQKSLIAGCFVGMVVFSTKVSPHNGFYVEDFFTKISGHATKNRYLDKAPTFKEKPDSLLTPSERKKKTAWLYVDSVGRAQLEKMKPQEQLAVMEKPALPKINIHSAPYWRKKDTTELQKQMLQFIAHNIPRHDTSVNEIRERRVPGKLIAMEQIIVYFRQHPERIITGAGAGNFSSKLAFRSTGMHIAGGYPSRFARISPEFLNNHFKLYLDYFSKDIELHSLLHSPNAVYAQLLSEYGVIGIAAFFIFYVLYFIKRIRWSGYGLCMLVILLGALATDYWFEHLSIVIFFELLMLVHIKKMHAAN